MEDSPQETRRTAATDPDTTRAAPPPGSDLSSVIDAMQASFEQVRRAARAEGERLVKEHRAERSRLRAEIDALRSRTTLQDERLQGLETRLRAVLEEYHGDLERQERRADAVRIQRERVHELLEALGGPVGSIPQISEPAGPQRVQRLSGDTVSPAPEPRETPLAGAPVERRAIPLTDDSTQLVNLPPGASESVPRDQITDDARRNIERQDADETLQIPIVQAQERSLRLVIRGVSSVTAMLRLRKAVETMPEIRRIESREVADGVLRYVLRSRVDADALADELTSLEDPTLRRIEVSVDAIELEM